MSGEAVTVTQADRQLVKLILGETTHTEMGYKIDRDLAYTAEVQAVARHRQSLAPTAGDELVERQAQIELWFFRDLFDAHRDALIALCFGAAIADEAKHNSHAQRRLLRKLFAATCIQSDAATIAGLKEALSDLVDAIDAPRYGDDNIWDDLIGFGGAELGPLERARSALATSKGGKDE